MFCPLPFNHIFFRADRSVYPCCETNTVKSYFDETIQKTANNDEFKKLRLEFLEDRNQLPEGCQRCTIVEKSNKKSVRLNSLEKFSNLTIDYAKKITNTDGSIDNFKLERLDVRSSNLCNYKCRFCGIISSNSWLQDHIKLELGLPNEYNSKTGIAEFNVPWNDLKTYLPHVKQLKLAGGEPVIMSGTYQILEEMIRIKNIDCSIVLITNASFITHGNKNIIELLKHFNNVNINLSIDGIEDAHAWLRSGKNDWKQVEQNISQYIDVGKQNNWNIFFHTGISWMNMYHVEKLIRKYPTSKFLLNPVTNPIYYSISGFKKQETRKVLKYYKKTIKKETNSQVKKKLIDLYKLIEMQQTNIEKTYIEQFIEITKVLDSSRMQNFKTVFPEFAGVMNES